MAKIDYGRSEYNRAISEQDSLFSTLQGLFPELGQGARDAIDYQAGIASSNLTGSMTARGMAGSSLMPVGEAGIEKQRQHQLNDLTSGLMQGQIEALLGAQTGAADVEFQKSAAKDMADLLGRPVLGFDASIMQAARVGRGQGEGGGAYDYIHPSQNRPGSTNPSYIKSFL